MDQLSVLNPDLIINIAASPFSHNHDRVKTSILTENARQYKLPLVYVNQTGANTELIFDGGSMFIDSSGNIVKRLNWFNEDFQIVSTEDRGELNLYQAPDRIRLIHDALVTGIKDYFYKTGFRTGVLGLSGGIDSAVVLALACSALGKENMKSLLMPSVYSSDHSVNDAVLLANNLGTDYEIINIQAIFEAFNETLKPVFLDRSYDLTEENIQARIRGNLLMAYSNKYGNLLLNTSNKSEGAVGYGTLYGDMSGSISVLGDVYKTDVYRLAEYINRENEVIPRNIITKPPSAELRPDQKDSDSLPEYELLDQVLYQYIELKRSAGEIIKSGMDKDLVEMVIQLVNRNEYKRYQAPPVLRVSSKAFGYGRRMPLVARY